MELREFIKETLLQIMDGVEEARNDIPITKGVISPRHYNGAKNSTTIDGFEYSVQIIEFEIGLQSEEGSKLKSGIGVAFGAINAGAGKGSDKKDSSITKVKFSVPVILPRSKT